MSLGANQYLFVELGELTVEGMRDVVRDTSSGKFFERGGIEDEQERALLPRIEDNREQETVILGCRRRPGYKDRLAGIARRLRRRAALPSQPHERELVQRKMPHACEVSAGDGARR
jgi:hypothetical protein